ncbi:MAG: crnA 2 [Nitrososphaeraceae archaeon]|nr:crnA 2 [Nitrososphaeraceae archaeon]
MANNSEVMLEEMNSLQVRNRVNRKTVAILVFGACENHGDHMPFGSDFILVKNGISRILIINGHDGNIPAVELAARITKDRCPEVIISCLEAWWVLVGEITKGLFETWNGLGHGGEAETSAMLAVRPDLVDMNNAPKEIIPNLPNNIRIYFKFNELTNTGATGAPMKASIQKGQSALNALEDVLLSYINKMEKYEWKYGLSLNEINDL